MKKLFVFLALFTGSLTYAQTPENTFSAKIDGKEWQAPAQRLNIPFTGIKYLAVAGMAVKPDVQLWIRFYYVDQLKPGTYTVIPTNERDIEKQIRTSGENVLFATVDYTEETKGLGHAFRDGESMKGTVTLTKATETSVEGTFDATLRVVNYKKRALDTISGFGLRQNIEDKVITAAGGGMLVKSDAHDHDNTRRMVTDEEMKITDGKFNVNWSKSATAQKGK